ncbi:MAG: hypothetical protein ABSH34_26375, partial [Verrucomicrobiota bacterium]
MTRRGQLAKTFVSSPCWQNAIRRVLGNEESSASARRWRRAWMAVKQKRASEEGSLFVTGQDYAPL